MKLGHGFPRIDMLRALLKPVLRFCVASGIRIQEIDTVMRSLLIECAREALDSVKEKENKSRLSAMTGMTRREVDRVKLLPVSKDSAAPADVLTKVVGRWLSASAYRDRKGLPKVLMAGVDSPFDRLVREVSSDINSGTVLFELKRLEFVEETAKGVKLLTDSFAPRGELQGGLHILSSDLSDLIGGVTANLLAPEEAANLHARTHFDRVRSNALSEIKEFVFKTGHEFHARIREYLARFDQDISPDPRYGGPTTSVTVTSFALVPETEDSQKSEDAA